jgi:hypothetical protein
MSRYVEQMIQTKMKILTQETEFTYSVLFLLFLPPPRPRPWWEVFNY